MYNKAHRGTGVGQTIPLAEPRLLHMRQVTVRGLWNSARQPVLSSLALGLVTVFSYNFHVNPATVVLMYALVVAVQSLAAGFISSAIVSVIAAGCLAYFFFPPILSLRISDPANVLALFAFLIFA